MDTGRFVQFDQDRLDAYELARVLARETEILLKRVSRGHAEHRDQVRRASLSISLNTAAGAGEFKPTEKARFLPDGAAVRDGSRRSAGQLRGPRRAAGVRPYFGPDPFRRQRVSR
jgi:hypothetical protein